MKEREGDGNEIDQRGKGKEPREAKGKRYQGKGGELGKNKKWGVCPVF